MQSPEAVRQALATRFARWHRRWFVQRQQADDGWPLALTLGRPTEQDLIADHAAVRAWVASWAHFEAAHPELQVDWADRQWPRLGRQRVPERLVLASADEVARLIGQGSRWHGAGERADRLIAAWPALQDQAALGRVWEGLADQDEADFDRLLGLLNWARANPGSGLYLRQLPVAGLDTKWIASRAGLVTELLRPLRSEAIEAADVHALLGLRRPSARIRVRLLCPSLRARMGGAEDLELPVEQLARLDLPARTVLIVENLETGLALPDMPGVVAVMKLGAAVKLVAALPWMAQAHCLYWGDIDTFGFEILNRARSAVPHLRSVLMDAETLLAHPALCVPERTQAGGSVMPLLTAEEHEVVDGLRSDRWGVRLRLEQERIPWAFALARLQAAMQAAMN